MRLILSIISSHKEIPGMGITAEYLKEKGIEVYSEDDIDSLL